MLFSIKIFEEANDFERKVPVKNLETSHINYDYYLETAS